MLQQKRQLKMPINFSQRLKISWLSFDIQLVCLPSYPSIAIFFFLLIEWTNISAAGFFNTSSSIFTLKLAPRVVHLSLFCLTSLSRDWNNNDTHSKKSANNVNSVFHLLLLVVAVYFTAYFLKRFCK